MFSISPLLLVTFINVSAYIQEKIIIYFIEDGIIDASNKKQVYFNTRLSTRNSATAGFRRLKHMWPRQFYCDVRFFAAKR